MKKSASTEKGKKKKEERDKDSKATESEKAIHRYPRMGIFAEQMMQKSSDISNFSSDQLHGQYPSNFFEPEAVRERAAAASAVLFSLLLVSAATVKKQDYFLCDHPCDPWSRTSYNSREMSVAEFGYSEHSLNSSRRKFRQLAGNAAPSVVSGVMSHSNESTTDSGIPRTRSKASPKTRFQSIPRAIGSRAGEKAIANAPGIPKAASVGSAILSYSSVRKLSSTTYLRRIHLSRDDAAAFFPESKETMEFIFATDMTRCVSPEQFKVELSVSLQDGQGRRWPVVLECLRSAGQRHVRLNKGWAEVCRATGLSVGKSIRLARLEQASSSSDAHVTVSLV